MLVLISVCAIQSIYSINWTGTTTFQSRLDFCWSVTDLIYYYIEHFPLKDMLKMALYVLGHDEIHRLVIQRIEHKPEILSSLFRGFGFRHLAIGPSLSQAPKFGTLFCTIEWQLSLFKQKLKVHLFTATTTTTTTTSVTETHSWLKFQ